MAPRNDQQGGKSSGKFNEIGVSGVRVNAGMVQDEFLRELQGHKGRETFRQMSMNDSTISAFLYGVEAMLRRVEWRVDPADSSQKSQDAARFVEGVRNDMTHSWDDFISEVLTFLVYGWSYFEIVWKRRDGPDARDSGRRSDFNDGRIGVRKLAPRAQHTLDRWEIDDNGGIKGMYQWPPHGGSTVFIPIEKALLFRTKTAQGSPEGRSILRGAYKSWYYLTNIQMTEAIGIERELAGMPVAKVPNEVLTDSNRSEERIAYERIVRDLRYNSQGGLVLPSEPYEDANGNITSQPMVSLELMSSSGQRSIDPSVAITRYQQDIARSVLADFLMIGTNRGSFALSASKQDLFLQSLEAYLSQIRDVLNRHLIPRLWTMNGFDRSTMPAFGFDSVAPVDLDELGAFLRRIAGAGMPLDPEDEETRSQLLARAGLKEGDGADPENPDGGDAGTRTRDPGVPNGNGD